MREYPTKEEEEIRGEVSAEQERSVKMSPGKRKKER